MTPRTTTLAATALAAALAAGPAHIYGQAINPQEHEQHHQAQGGTPSPGPPAAATQQGRMGGAGAMGNMGDMEAMMSRMRANDAKLDALVTKMQSARGAEKTEAIAELLAALVADRKNLCEPMMADMMSMKNMMAGPGHDHDAAPKK